MWLFEKQGKKKEIRDNPSMSDKVAGKIAGAGIILQKKFADRLNGTFRNMNSKKLKGLLILFCLSAGSYSVYLSVNAIIGQEKRQKNFTVDQVDVPKHFDKTGDEILTDASVDEETFYKIQAFKKYMENLKQNMSMQYDSILQTRPGLLDSVQVLEGIYYSQNQK